MQLPNPKDLKLINSRSFQAEDGKVWKVSLDFKDTTTNLYWNASYQDNGINSLYHLKDNCLQSVESFAERLNIEDYTKEKENNILSEVKNTHSKAFLQVKPRIDFTSNPNWWEIKQVVIDYAMAGLKYSVITSRPIKIKGMRKPSQNPRLMLFISTNGDLCLTGAKSTGNLIADLPIITIN